MCEVWWSTQCPAPTTCVAAAMHETACNDRARCTSTSTRTDAHIQTTTTVSTFLSFRFFFSSFHCSCNCCSNWWRTRIYNSQRQLSGHSTYLPTRPALPQCCINRCSCEVSLPQYVSSPPLCLPLELINHRPLLSTLASLFPPSLDT